MPANLQGVTRTREAASIRTDRIIADPDQPRTEFDPEALNRLSDSLKAKGQLQPIRVRWDEARGAYVVIVGERRWRAAIMAGIETLACIIVDGAVEPSELLAIQLVENALREDLKPVEQARAYRRLMDAKGWSTRQLAAELAVAQPQVVRTLALLELPEGVQEAVEQGALAPGTAYEVSKLESPEDQAEVAARVVNEKLTRDQVSEVVRARKEGRPIPGVSGPAEFRVSPKCTVMVKYKGEDKLSVLQALKAAVRMAQAELARGEEAA
jgi:ParB family chromosome partitioning protein